MAQTFDPEAVDLSSVQQELLRTCGPFVEGEIVGRTVLRDGVAQHLGCSVLEAEILVDTMVGRGFLRRETQEDGRTGWTTRGD